MTMTTQEVITANELIRASTFRFLLLGIICNTIILPILRALAYLSPKDDDLHAICAIVTLTVGIVLIVIALTKKTKLTKVLADYKNQGKSAKDFYDDPAVKKYFLG